MNLDTELSLAKSLSAHDINIIKHLPYLLQDLWELGTSPTELIQLIKSLQKNSKEFKVLDLACGKGATSIQMAKVLGCRVKGIDLIEDFINYAKQKAEEWRVSKICEFQCSDVNKAIKKEKNYDVVILGAAGDIIGDQKTTVKKLKKTVKKGGYIIISEAYSGKARVKGYISYEEWRKIFTKAKLKLISEKIPDDSQQKEQNDGYYSLIEKRANELKEKYPHNAEMFDNYMQAQAAENEDLEYRLQGITFMLQK